MSIIGLGFYSSQILNNNINFNSRRKKEHNRKAPTNTVQSNSLGITYPDQYMQISKRPNDKDLTNKTVIEDEQTNMITADEAIESLNNTSFPKLLNDELEKINRIELPDEKYRKNVSKGKGSYNFVLGNIYTLEAEHFTSGNAEYNVVKGYHLDNKTLKFLFITRHNDKPERDTDTSYDKYRAFYRKDGTLFHENSLRETVNSRGHSRYDDLYYADYYEDGKTPSIVNDEFFDEKGNETRDGEEIENILDRRTHGFTLAVDVDARDVTVKPNNQIEIGRALILNNMWFPFVIR